MSGRALEFESATCSFPTHPPTRICVSWRVLPKGPAGGTDVLGSGWVPVSPTGTLRGGDSSRFHGPSPFLVESTETADPSPARGVQLLVVGGGGSAGPA